MPQSVKAPEGIRLREAGELKVSLANEAKERIPVDLTGTLGHRATEYRLPV